MWVCFRCGSAGEESPCHSGDLGSIPGLGRSPREGKGYPLQYCGLENSMDCIVHGVAKIQTRLSDFHFQQCGHFVVGFASLNLGMLLYFLALYWLQDLHKDSLP